jgi:hypothetical protein
VIVVVPLGVSGVQPCSSLLNSLVYDVVHTCLFYVLISWLNVGVLVLVGGEMMVFRFWDQRGYRVFDSCTREVDDIGVGVVLVALGRRL